MKKDIINIKKYSTAKINDSYFSTPLAGGCQPAPNTLGLVAYLIINHDNMGKKAIPAYKVSTMEEYSSFAGSIGSSSGKTAAKKVVANATNISSLSLHILKDLDEKIYLSQTKVDMNLEGDVGVYNAALLSPKFTRRGFKGRNINLSIPSSLDAASKTLLEERICSFAKEGSASKVKDHLSKGAVISMDEAKELGLIDTVIDLSKRRGSNAGKSAVVASEDNPASENTSEKS